MGLAGRPARDGVISNESLDGHERDGISIFWRRTTSGGGNDPTSVDETWRIFFEGYELGRGGDGVQRTDVDQDAARSQAAVTRLIDAYREIGHYLADLDPLEAQPAARVARTARPGGFRPHRGRPRQVVLHQADRPAVCLAPRPDRRAPGDVLPEDRRRVHAHPQHRGPPLAPGADGAGPEPAAVRPQAKAADHLKLNAAELFETFLSHALRRPEAVLARRGRDADPAARRDHRAVGNVRRPRDRAGDAASGPAQRPGQHLEQALRDDLRRVRGEPSRDRWRRRRRQVSPRLLGRPHHGRQAHDPPVADAQPEPPGGRQPGGRGARPGQAAAVQGQGPQARRADPDPRRRRVRRPGAGGRDPEPLAAARLSHRRDDPHRRQQPDRLHDGTRATAARPGTAPTSPR